MKHVATRKLMNKFNRCLVTLRGIIIYTNNGKETNGKRVNYQLHYSRSCFHPTFRMFRFIIILIRCTTETLNSLLWILYQSMYVTFKTRQKQTTEGKLRVWMSRSPILLIGIMCACVGSIEMFCFGILFVDLFFCGKKVFAFVTESLLSLISVYRPHEKVYH